MLVKVATEVPYAYMILGGERWYDLQIGHFQRS